MNCAVASASNDPCRPRFDSFDDALAHQTEISGNNELDIDSLIVHGVLCALSDTPSPTTTCNRIGDQYETGPTHEQTLKPFAT